MSSTITSTPAPGAWGIRLIRGLCGIAAFTCLLAAFLLWLVTRSWFISWQVEPELQRRMGGEVTIGNAAYLGEGRFVFDAVALYATVLDGPGSRVAKLDRVAVSIDMDALLQGRMEVVDIELRGAHLRLSEDAHHSGLMNFMTLEPDWSEDDPQIERLPPRVRILDAVIEYGVHTEEAYESLGFRYVSGEMYPTAGEEGWYSVELHETDATGTPMPEGGLSIEGDWNVTTNEHKGRIDGFELNESTYVMSPQIVRLWWDRMELEGRVADVRFHWQPADPFTLDMAVDNLALTLPIETRDMWALYRDGAVEPTSNRPRMAVHSGTISLSGDRLVLDRLAGEFGGAEGADAIQGVPYEVTVEIDSLPRLDWDQKELWMSQVLELAPFSMVFSLYDFHVGGPAAAPGAGPAEPGPAIELPALVARTMERFEMTGWRLTTEVEVSRGEAVADASGALAAPPIETSGSAFIREGSGAYERFPYWLEEVEAYLEFDSNQVDIHRLRGRGSGEAVVDISGTIKPPGANSAVALHVTANDVPLDERLYAALRPHERAAFDALLHGPSYEALRAAGVLVTPAEVRAARQEADIVAEEIDRWWEDHALDDPEAVIARDEQARRLRRLDEVAATPPFELGGRVAIDLHLHREPGSSRPIDITGSVQLDSVGLLYGRFPYPLVVEGGLLEWRSDAIGIVPSSYGEGLLVRTPSGGAGLIVGEVALPAPGGTGRLQPDLTLRIDGDPVSQALCAAIPPTTGARDEAGSAEDWPGAGRSKAARLLEAIGLRGRLSYEGRVTTDQAGQVQYEFSVGLAEGSARPTDQLSSVLGDVGLLGSSALALNDLEGLLQVTPDRIELVEFTGRHDDARLSATGRIDLGGESRDTVLDVDFEDLALGRYLIDLAREDGIERAVRLWDRYRPSGTFDAHLHYESSEDEVDLVRLELEPRSLFLMIDDRPTLARCTGGGLSISGGQVHFDDLTLELSSDDRQDGVVTLDGAYGPGEGDGALRLEGAWSEGQLDSPLIAEALRLIGAEAHADRYLGYTPVGEFDATFGFVSGSGDAPAEYEFVIVPRTVAVKVDQTPVFAQLQPGGSIAFVPGRVELERLRGQHAGGTFTVDGTVRTDGAIDAELSLSYDGSLLSSQMQAFLPEQVRAMLSAMEFQEGERSSISGARLRMTQLEPGDPVDRWRTSFAGQIQTRSASFVGGVAYANVDGVFDIAAQREPDRTPIVVVQADIDRMETLGLVVTDVDAPIVLGSDGETVEIPELRGELHHGALHISASIGIGDRRDYRLVIEVVGADLDEFFESVRLAAMSADGLDAPETDAVGAVAEAETTEQGALPTGELYAMVSLQGERGRAHLRTGRGLIRVLGGRVAGIPLVMRVVQVVNLTLPISSDLDYAEVDFYVDGDRLELEQILFESTIGDAAALQLFGEGSLDIETLELAAWFRSRGGMVLLRDLIGELGDRLYLIEVSGPLRDPVARIVPLPSTPTPRSDRRTLSRGAVSSFASTEDESR